MKSRQARVIQWARELLKQEFLVLDTETTGLEYGDEPVQIGIADKTGDVLFDSLIRPARARIGREAQRIHGITPEMVANAPTLADVALELRQLLTKQVVLVYNASYDRMIMEAACEANEIDDLTGYCTWIDVMEPYARFWGDWHPYRASYRWQSLTNACAQQGIPFEDSHTALGDARATLALLKALAGLRVGRQSGVVKVWDKNKGFGFIRSADGIFETFCHFSAIEDGRRRNLTAGQQVEYEVVWEEKGIAARNVQVLG
jgi:DNA polymerase-3 subunit epsilon